MSWIQIDKTTFRLMANALNKGAMHKYLKRVPTGRMSKTGRPLYRYYYSMGGGAGHLLHDAHLSQVGASFKVGDKNGHAHVAERHDGGFVTLHHDETNRRERVHVDDLRDRINEAHGEAIAAHGQQQTARRADEARRARAHGTPRQQDLAQDRASAAARAFAGGKPTAVVNVKDDSGDVAKERDENLKLTHIDHYDRAAYHRGESRKLAGSTNAKDRRLAKYHAAMVNHHSHMASAARDHHEGRTPNTYNLEEADNSKRAAQAALGVAEFQKQQERDGRGFQAGRVGAGPTPGGAAPPQRKPAAPRRPAPAPAEAKSPAPAETKKPKMTGTNLYALHRHFGDADVQHNSVAPTSRPHIKRAMDAGLVERSEDGRQLHLTEEGKKAIAPERARARDDLARRGGLAKGGAAEQALRRLRDALARSGD